MVKHIVVWKLKDEAHGNTKQENAALIREKLEALNGRIPGLLKLEIGFDFSNTENSGDIVLYSEFISRDALEAYQSHPEHEAVKPFVLGARCERRLVDYEV
ncbi:Dabb family protein [bacterium]|nr:Dabb family protein [bacterium]